MDEGDLKRLMDVLAKTVGANARRDHALFALLAGTGIRLGSCVALNVEDIDLERVELQLRTTKNDRPDVVFLPAAMCEHLRGFIGVRASGPLFVGCGGKRLGARHVQRLFATWCERAGVTRRASVHSLRHAFACRLYGRTHDLLVVQRALTHRSLHSTLRYAAVDERRVRAALMA